MDNGAAGVKPAAAHCEGSFGLFPTKEGSTGDKKEHESRQNNISEKKKWGGRLYLAQLSLWRWQLGRGSEATPLNADWDALKFMNEAGSPVTFELCRSNKMFHLEGKTIRAALWNAPAAESRVSLAFIYIFLLRFTSSSSLSAVFCSLAGLCCG